jgi:hypothetical protein
MSGLDHWGRAGVYLGGMMLASEKTRNSTREFKDCLLSLG